ncbi:hypothetical protein C6A85_20915, partial [Mycobacterium sp. ITM-2017-0098]
TFAALPIVLLGGISLAIVLAVGGILYALPERRRPAVLRPATSPPILGDGPERDEPPSSRTPNVRVVTDPS